MRAETAALFGETSAGAPVQQVRERRLIRTLVLFSIMVGRRSPTRKRLPRGAPEMVPPYTYTQAESSEREKQTHGGILRNLLARLRRLRQRRAGRQVLLHRRHY